MTNPAKARLHHTADSPGQSVVECQNLHLAYARTKVLTGLDLQITPGMIVGLLGVNGCGKTTLLQCLVGLLRPDSGGASLFCEDAWDLSPKSKRRIGYAPQIPALPPWMTVGGVISTYAAFHVDWSDERCNELISRFEIDNQKLIRSLSVGQVARVSLVLAMAHQPDLLILDEPAAALDPAGRRQLLSEILEQNQRHGQTTLFSTHITSDIERVASHVAILSNGRLSYFGELDGLKDHVKRLRISSEKLIDYDFRVENSIDSRVEGHSAVVTVAAVTNEEIARIEQEYQASVTVENLNLEDITLEMHDA